MTFANSGAPVAGCVAILFIALATPASASEFALEKGQAAIGDVQDYRQDR